MRCCHFFTLCCDTILNPRWKALDSTLRWAFCTPTGPGWPSLALDMMEELRSVLADRLALTLINRRQVQAEGFIAQDGGRHPAGRGHSQDRDRCLADTQAGGDRTSISERADSSRIGSVHAGSAAGPLHPRRPGRLSRISLEIALRHGRPGKLRCQHARRSGKRRLRRVARLCEDRGQRVQNSVFECLLDAAQWTLFRAALLREVDLEQDSLRFYFLGNHWKNRVEHMGAKPLVRSPRAR